MWGKQLLFEGWRKGCRQGQRHNGETAFLKSIEALIERVGKYIREIDKCGRGE